MHNHRFNFAVRRISQLLNGPAGYRTIRKMARSHRIFRVFITAVILLNISSIFLASFSHYKLYHYFLQSTTVFSLVIFTVEYLLRLYSAPALFPDVSHAKARLRYAVSLFGVIDFLAISPFVLSFINNLLSGDPMTNFGTNYQIINTIKVLLFVKLMRYSHTFRFLMDVFRSVKRELAVAVTAAIIVIIISGSLMYYVESEAQPEAFYDIGQGFWWSIITFATVGYGDIYPITPLGKIIASLIAFIGIGTIALPAGIISSAFYRKVNAEKNGTPDHPVESSSAKSVPESDPAASKKCYCPYCGHKLDDEQQKKE